jgi:hypothetical protein
LHSKQTTETETCGRTEQREMPQKLKANEATDYYIYLSEKKGLIDLWFI